MPSQVDLHMHSNASDGTDSPIQLVENVKMAGIRIFSLTDHDTTAGVMQLAKVIPEEITFIPGIEFSCRMESGKCHILGYNCDVEHPSFRSALSQGEILRQLKLDKRLEFLQERGISFPDMEIEGLHQIPSVGKPHLANLMVQYGYAESKETAIKDTINLCATGSSRILAETAVRAILDAGGIPIWAHPLGGEGERLSTLEQFTARLEELISFGLMGMECYYSKYSMTHCVKLAEIAKERRLLISGGSDYHGANKAIGLGTLNSEGLEITREQITLLDALIR